jgi:hypothetical protein
MFIRPAEGSLGIDELKATETAYYEFTDGTRLTSGPHPFYHPEYSQDPAEFDQHGRWIGLDTTNPCRLITSNVARVLAGEQIAELFKMFQHYNYGTGEAGFASYLVPVTKSLQPFYGKDVKVWLIDDAVRSPEGEPPARDPHLSPGPQTLLFPEEY